MITSMIIFSNYIILSQPIFLAIIFLCSLRLDISLSALPLPISLCSLPPPDLSLLSPKRERREIWREIRRGREIGGGETREGGERAYMCLETTLAETTTENYRLETTPVETTTENHRSCLILLSSFSWRRRRGCRENFWRGIFWRRPSEFGSFYKKSTCFIT